MSVAAGAEPLVETWTAREAFADLFLRLYGLPEPVVRLADVLHWSDVVRRLGLAGGELDRRLTCVFHGFFYNTSTAAPSASEVRDRLAWGRARGVDQFLVPTVRDAAAAEPLAAAGFERIPWVVESVMELDEPLDAALRRRLGRTRRGGLMQAVRRAADRYPPRFFRGADVLAEPGLLATAAALHERNVEKYGHARNFYSEPILRRLSASALGDALVVCLREDRRTGQAVQCSIALMDPERAQLYQLVQGIAHDRVVPGHNLFVATVYEMARYGEAHGVREVNLGRGAPEQKVRLGANRLNLLNHWILAPRGAAGEVRELAARCGRELALVAGGVAPR